MSEIEKRIYVDDEILMNEYDYRYGKKSSVNVAFRYYQVEKDKMSHPIMMTYTKALNFARNRRHDRRYRNYEFSIESRN